jgi:hypothetical protein
MDRVTLFQTALRCAQLGEKSVDNCGPYVDDGGLSPAVHRPDRVRLRPRTAGPHGVEGTGLAGWSPSTGSTGPTTTPIFSIPKDKNRNSVWRAGLGTTARPGMMGTHSTDSSAIEECGR